MRTLLVTGLLASAAATLAWAGVNGHQIRTSQGGSGNLPPVCCFGPDCQQTGETETIECQGDVTSFVLDATGSYDPEGQPLTYLWESCPGSTIDDPTSPLTILRIDTSSNCDINCGVRLRVDDGFSQGYCRIFVQVTAPVGGCSYTQGYWKTHGPAGCASGNNQNEWPVDNLSLGNTNYTDGELCSIFKASVNGNGLISLAHQLIAAKLNVANGASLPQVVADAIENADKAIGNLVVPPVGGGYLAPSTTSFLVGLLTAYNEGLVAGTVNCD
ncbi:MAG TPA: hypothetical protein VMT18_08760 [Planctomycetota bacterium]|nr:hypothetical protein [Planctomycetota bacterium]